MHDVQIVTHCPFSGTYTFGLWVCRRGRGVVMGVGRLVDSQGDATGDDTSGVGKHGTRVLLGVPVASDGACDASGGSTVNNGGVD